ncbi:hypothetical protein ACFS07_23640 [Undibacterium arcticum]
MKAPKKPLGKKATPARLAKSKGSSAKFPSTGGDFWIDLITDQPQSAADILNAAFYQASNHADQRTETEIRRPDDCCTR